MSGIIWAAGNWTTQTGTPDTAPGSGKYRADNWAAPTMLAFNVIDTDGYTRNVATLIPGDTITQFGSNDSQNYITMVVSSVVNNVTWVQVAVSVYATGSAFVAPGSNQERFLEAIREVTTPQGSGLPPLASPDDIVARLGRSLNQVETARVDALLMDASAIIRRYCREDFVWYPHDSITILGDGGFINMETWKPIGSIDSVTAISGIDGIPDLPVTWFAFDGISRINIPAPAYSGIINLPEFWYQEEFWWGNSFLVTGSHGYQTTPDDVMSVLCPAIVSELSTPTMSATLMSESIGAYSYSMRRTSGAGLSAALTDAGMKTVLSDYRKTQGTLKVRM